MIRREEGRDWLLIPQIEHAHVAGDVAAVWGNDEVAAFPDSRELLSAVRHHDDGWREWDTAPRLHAETGIPRSFLEMPMPVATEIWSRSIEIASRGTSSWLNAVKSSQVLKPSATSPAEVQNSIVESIFRLGRPFTGEETMQDLLAHSNPKRDIREIVFRTLHLLELGGWVRKSDESEAEQRFQIAFPFDPPSPLAGIAVSKHFTWLAEQATESRGDEPKEMHAVECFLESQRHQQRVLHNAALETWNGSAKELTDLQDRGYRAVQFFDRLSLWLCCAPRRDAVELECPGRGMFRLVPLEATRIAIEPFPLADGGDLELSVSAKRIAARRYANDDDLLNALHDAEAERLNWTLTSSL